MGLFAVTGETAFHGIGQLGALYRSGSLTPLDVVRGALERLATLEPLLNAMAFTMGEQAIEEASRLTDQLHRGDDLGPLHGIPIAIKDLIEVEGVPTGFGSRVRPPAVAKADAELVKRLREAGAVIIGKTNLLEYAYGIAHPEIGQTNNPHDTGRTSGGSSGGSAAVVAAGIVPLAVGTDTGGSIRIPASYCGIVGLKPTYGLVPLDGVFPLSWSLDHAGPLCRSVEDTVIAMECLAATSLRHTPPSIAGLRIGLLRDHFDNAAVTAGVAENMQEAIAALEKQGAIIRDLRISDLGSANSELRKVLLPEASLIHRELHAENATGYAPKTRAQIEAGSGVSAVDYLRAQDFRRQLRAAIEDQFAEADVLLSPSVPFVAPMEDPEFTEDGEEGEMLSSGFATMTGHPSLSLPCGISENLPVGLQLTGRLGHDGELLAVALTIETALDAFPRPVTGQTP